MVAAAVALPFFIYPTFVMKVMCFAIFASAFNLLFGFGGLLSFGHAAYFGVAAYMCGYAAKYWGVTPEVAILFGVACSSMLGFLFGALATRRQGIYFAMITLALAQMVFFLCVQTKLLGGEDGLQGIPRGKLFGLLSLDDDRTLYFFVLAVFVASIWFVRRVVRSPFGHVLKAIRDNEARATSLGYHVDHYKIIVFTLSAGLAGLAGSLKALAVQLATLTDVSSGTSADVVVMTLVGGIGTIFGPAIGATVITSMEYYLAPFGAWVGVVQGVIFIVCVLVFREGIAGAVRKLLGRRRSASGTASRSPTATAPGTGVQFSSSQ
ncbi:branched-chain amino acid ABC transporter permease [Bradyrhizobium sp. LTSP885]|uniref:branched-chain amino acid ABC transporter permease n=1 Tax=Bradyrhizobium sp. LTSP885 TaxID=1619232 RepID=UPI0018CEC621